MDFDEIIITDYRGFIFDVNVKEYFGLEASKYDKSETRKLNPINRKHRTEFKETLENYINQMGLLNKTMQVCANRVTQHEMNALDDSITYVLTAAQKKVEGIQRNVPYSYSKQVKESTLKYIKGLINKKKGKRVDEGAIKRRKEYCKIDMDELSLPELEDRYTGAKIEWEEFKREAMKKKDQKLLELYPIDIIGDSDVVKK